MTTSATATERTDDQRVRAGPGGRRRLPHRDRRTRQGRRCHCATAGVDIEDLVGRVGFDDVWGLLVDDAFGSTLPVDISLPPVRSGDVRADVQAAMPLLAPARRYAPLLDISDEQARDQLAATTAAALSYVARSARGDAPEVPESLLAGCSTIVERFLTAWLGDPTPEQITAIDAYWVSAAEHGMNASTFTARVVASTGADIPACFAGAIGSMSGPLHGGAPARVLPMIQEVERTGDAAGLVKGILDRKEKLMGFGHRVYRAEDPRARVLRRTCQELGAERYEVAAALEQAALTELRERRPDRAIETNVEFWAAVILDFAGVPPASDAGDVHLCPDGRLERAHPRAEAAGPARPAIGDLRRARPAHAGRGRRVRLTRRVAGWTAGVPNRDLQLARR